MTRRRSVDIREAADTVRASLSNQPRVGVVLGSGLGHLVSEVADGASISFEDVPGLPPSTVEGHAGRFVAGTLEGVPVLMQAGRYHAYEGHSMDTVVAPIRIAMALGVEVLVVTNAAGSLRPGFDPGGLVLIEDHINFMFRSPLRGPVRVGEARFPDMSAPYDAKLRKAAQRAAVDVGQELREGVYVGVLGPSFETAAEVRMLAGMGADVVGMSTVPEVTVARAGGVRCLGFSIVTNLATGLSSIPIDHDEVLDIGREAGDRLGRILRRMLAEWRRSDQEAGVK
jgi:purine-nucleoside phosphorylase